MDFADAWARLDPRFRVCVEQAWISLGRRGLPVGAVVSLEDEVVSLGRNRVYDPPGGPDPLQGTPIAHAEMNALASVAHDTDLDRCSIWSTHAPCTMCEAAIGFAGLASVRYLADDPSDEDPRASSPETVGDDSLWTVVVNAMFLHNVALVGGRDNPIVGRYASVEPEIARLALRLLDEGSFTRVSSEGGGLPEALTAVWESIVETNRGRLARG
ncbi:MAG TPA: nucleoside deaminase [Acidimicrobiia bacterium]|nr:nucleoside deaminase [Acidimicrobiia bacterium]